MSHPKKTDPVFHPSHLAETKKPKFGYDEHPIFLQCRNEARLFSVNYLVYLKYCCPHLVVENMPQDINKVVFPTAEDEWKRSLNLYRDPRFRTFTFTLMDLSLHIGYWSAFVMERSVELWIASHFINLTDGEQCAKANDVKFLQEMTLGVLESTSNVQDSITVFNIDRSFPFSRPLLLLDSALVLLINTLERSHLKPKSDLIRAHVVVEIVTRLVQASPKLVLTIFKDRDSLLRLTNLIQASLLLLARKFPDVREGGRDDLVYRTAEDLLNFLKLFEEPERHRFRSLLLRDVSYHYRRDSMYPYPSVAAIDHVAFITKTDLGNRSPESSNDLSISTPYLSVLYHFSNEPITSWNECRLDSNEVILDLRIAGSKRCPKRQPVIDTGRFLTSEWSKFTNVRNDSIEFEGHFPIISRYLRYLDDPFVSDYALTRGLFLTHRTSQSDKEIKDRLAEVESKFVSRMTAYKVTGDISDPVISGEHLRNQRRGRPPNYQKQYLRFQKIQREIEMEYKEASAMTGPAGKTQMMANIERSELLLIDTMARFIRDNVKRKKTHKV